MTYTRGIGSTLNVVGMGVNRIGKVAPSTVKEIDWLQRFVRVDLTCYKIKGSPAWENTGTIDKAYEHLLRIYYGWVDPGHIAKAPHAPPVAAPADANAIKEPV